MMRTVALDSQIASAIQDCETLANLQFIEDWQSTVKKEAFEKGDIGHIALKHFYTTIMVAQGLNAEDKLDKLQLIRESLNTASSVIPEQNIPVEEAERIVRITEGYFHHYQGEYLKVIAVERPFSKVLFEGEVEINKRVEQLRIVYEGIIDLLAETDLNGLTVFDHKTQGSDYQLIARDNQFTGYAWAFNTNWVIGNRIGLQKSEPKHGRYRRQILSVSDPVKEQWRKNLVRSVVRFLNSLENNDFEMNFAHCKVWGGCPFIDVCNVAHDKDVQLHVLMQSFFKGKKWSPYTRDTHMEIKE